MGKNKRRALGDEQSAVERMLKLGQSYQENLLLWGEGASS